MPKIKFNKSIDAILMLIVVILIGLIAFFNFKPATPSGIFKKNFKYTINNDEIYVIQYDGNLSSITIPQKVWVKGHQYTVTKILDEAFKDNSIIVSVKLPDTINYIGESSFENCSNLSNIEIPLSVSEIGLNAYSNCTSVKTIKYLSNQKCKIPLNGDIFNNVGINDKVSISIGENVENLPDFLFATSHINDNIHIKDITFETQNLTSIGKSTFSNADIDSIVIPDTVQTIGKNAFKSSTISEITLSKNLEFLPDYMFYNCKNLQQIVIPENTKIIGIRCFSNSGLISINIPKSLEYIGDSAFANSKLQIINYSGSKQEWNTINVDIVKSTEFTNSKITYEEY